LPEGKTETRPTPVATPAAAPLAAGVALVPEIQSVTVERGDSLWRISRRVLGRGVRYTQIYEANAGQIRDPNRIWPGQIFVAPK
jgi:nucleoid-associated protein YgaU